MSPGPWRTKGGGLPPGGAGRASTPALGSAKCLTGRAVTPVSRSPARVTAQCPEFEARCQLPSSGARTGHPATVQARLSLFGLAPRLPGCGEALRPAPHGATQPPPLYPAPGASAQGTVRRGPSLTGHPGLLRAVCDCFGHKAGTGRLHGPQLWAPWLFAGVLAPGREAEALRMRIDPPAAKPRVVDLSFQARSPLVSPAQLPDTLPSSDWLIQGGDQQELFPPLASPGSLQEQRPWASFLEHSEGLMGQHEPADPADPCPSACPGRVPVLTEAVAREALLSFVNSKCCFGQVAASDLVIWQLNQQTLCRYRLETFSESRISEWTFQPFASHSVDRPQRGTSPRLWDIKVQAPPMFQEDTRRFQVPHSSLVKVRRRGAARSPSERAPVCPGGRVRVAPARRVAVSAGRAEECHRCHGRGRDACGSCHGAGMRTGLAGVGVLPEVPRLGLEPGRWRRLWAGGLRPCTPTGQVSGLQRSQAQGPAAPQVSAVLGIRPAETWAGSLAAPRTPRLSVLRSQVWHVLGQGQQALPHLQRGEEAAALQSAGHRLVLITTWSAAASAPGPPGGSCSLSSVPRPSSGPCGAETSRKNSVFEFVSEHRLDCPQELLAKAKGERVFQDESAKVYLIVDFPLQALCQASRRGLAEHSAALAARARVLQQRQTIELVPLTEVRYWCRGRTLACCVYGTDHRVHAAERPPPCGCGCALL
ncbi:Protein SSUH2 [Galemys pyrenaicus]|uniref:Protein SSUH2 n=1 Tax=Galemys pyrenaicus TaxID=202257 RepID=A0A8J6DP95_GALPY|nr:Protein SSUH2 [Galemys pyrenaicus]